MIRRASPVPARPPGAPRDRSPRRSRFRIRLTERFGRTGQGRFRSVNSDSDDMEPISERIRILAWVGNCRT